MMGHSKYLGNPHNKIAASVAQPSTVNSLVSSATGLKKVFNKALTNMNSDTISRQEGANHNILKKVGKVTGEPKVKSFQIAAHQKALSMHTYNMKPKAIPQA